MIPAFQLTKTDCVKACVASLLEIKAEKVPDFTQANEVEGSDYPAFWLALQSWLADRGLWMLEVQLPANMPWFPVILPALCIFFGETPGGVKHAIVGRVDGAAFIPVHNPGKAEFSGGIAGLGFILPRDPSLTIKFGKALDKIERLAKGLPNGIIQQNIIHEAEQALGHQIN